MKHFDIRVADERVSVSWNGAWDDDAALEYVTALDRTLRNSPNARYLVVDATALEDFVGGVRRTLARHLESLDKRFQRTVFIAASARVRGMCLWMVRMAGDDNALVVAEASEAERWLAGNEGRLQRAMDRLTAHLAAIGRETK